MKTMYPAQVNSPGTELAGAIDAAQDTIQVADGSVLPDGPNLLTIGTDEAAETILYTGKTGDELTGVTRGFQGTAQSWAAGTKVARYFTAYDHDAAVSNISELSTGLKALGDAARDRLDIVERQDVVLNAGLQILNAQRRAAFSLNGIKGRTLVNLAGRKSYISSNDPSIVTLNVAVNSIYNNTDTINVDIKNTNEGYIVYKLVGNSSASISAGKYYMISAEVRINSISGSGQIKVGGTVEGAYTADKTKIGVWQKVFHRFTPPTNNTLSIIAGTCYAGGVFATANFDIKNISFFEISQSDYDNLRNLTEKELAEKYPYVDSVQPVRNPYAIRYGENLLPPFYEYVPSTSGSTLNIKTMYEADLITTATTQPWNAFIPVLGGGIYRLSYESSDPAIAYVNLQWLDEHGTPLGYTPKNENGQTVQAPASAVRAKVLVTATAAGTFNFKNLMLTLGSEAKPFKPREDAMLALQTDLYADPLTGANADEVFEKDGQYFKLAKWKKISLDGSIDWGMIAPFTGFKRLGFPHKDKVIDRSAIGVKYDGKILPEYRNVEATDKVTVDGLDLYVWVSNTDSGWGDNYTPTPDERKAYFMGWRMFNWGVGYDPYNGTGTKGWGKIYCGVGPDDGNGMVAGSGISTLPTTMNDMGYTPYQLVYQLATPTVEPIVSEGMLTFNEGDNQIEVGTGIVIRENAVPSKDSNNVWNIGNPVANQASKGFKYKAKSVIAVYKNSLRDYEWLQYVTEKYGALVQEKQPNAIYDPSAAYSATYLMLDKSLIVPFNGSYAANEKAMLQELTDAVQQNATAVSVLMNKKVDKDQPGWITPTLLNGWVNFSTDYYGAGYVKTSDGLVFFRGIIRNGPVGQNIFILPPGFRPSKTLILDAISHNNSTYIASAVRVYPDGRVFLDVGSFYHLSLESINPFLAEQ
jgi:hypothetical protein